MLFQISSAAVPHGSTVSRLGVDVGGTFTDVVLHGEDGGATVRKLLSTPPSYDVAVIEAARDLTHGHGAEIEEVVHGTTVATNAVLERRGSKTALVTTAGFRDVLELRRLRIPHMYDLFWRKPPPLVPRRLRLEVSERVLADGTVARALDEDEARAVGTQLRKEGVESVAVCLLHSYLHPDHEERLGAILTEELPAATISLSSEILREQREYERSATTVVNAYVRPLVASYLDRIRGGLDDLGIRAPLRIMQSSGGVMTSSDARVRPVYALESGPAAGVVAALGIARRLGWSNVISLDMGGTTAKASLIERGVVSRAREYEVGGSLSAGSRLLRGAGELLRIPAIDIAEVGAGGGSIAFCDPAGGLHVGPRSAGANPGPACYGLGGTEPTVTDANVLLGYMPAAALADGEISVSAGLAQRAVATVAEALGLPALETARGIHDIANARMTRALRAVSSEKGRDPRDFALIAYGGAGPIHAVGLADALGVRTVLVPALAGLFSSLGLLFARPELHDVRACQLDAREGDRRAVEAAYAELERRLAAVAPSGPVEWTRSAELRYAGQSWEIEVDFGRDESLAELLERFEAEHERLYGVKGEPGSPVEIRALRIAAVGPPSGARGLHVNGAGPRRSGTRRAHFGGETVAAAIRSRPSIRPEAEPGPLLVDEYDTTVVVPPEWTVRRDEGTDTLILERADRRG
jgi:N-methylhydantoinase A/oxoprolinase/acetone carboxylase beta subunit